MALDIEDGPQEEERRNELAGRIALNESILLITNRKIEEMRQNRALQTESRYAMIKAMYENGLKRRDWLQYERALSDHPFDESIWCEPQQDGLVPTPSVEGDLCESPGTASPMLLYTTLEDPGRIQEDGQMKPAYSPSSWYTERKEGHEPPTGSTQESPQESHAMESLSTYYPRPVLDTPVSQADVTLDKPISKKFPFNLARAIKRKLMPKGDICI